MPRIKSTASPTASVSARRQPKLTRAEKSQKIRESLFEAAAKVIGQEGYASAMISMITMRADVAHGTFYNHFESRQDLFDQLLPALGREMLTFIGEEAAGASNAIEREERSFRAFFTFLKVKPEFYRILYEAELFAPTAFQQHMETVASGYVRVLERAASHGELRVGEKRELEAAAYMLMGIRYYLCMRFARRDGETISLPEWVVRTYMTFATGGIFLPPSSPAPAESSTPPRSRTGRRKKTDQGSEAKSQD